MWGLISWVEKLVEVDADVQVAAVAQPRFEKVCRVSRRISVFLSFSSTARESRGTREIRAIY